MVIMTTMYPKHRRWALHLALATTVLLALAALPALAGLHQLGHGLEHPSCDPGEHGGEHCSLCAQFLQMGAEAATAGPQIELLPSAPADLSDVATTPLSPVVGSAGARAPPSFL